MIGQKYTVALKTDLQICYYVYSRVHSVLVGDSRCLQEVSADIVPRENYIFVQEDEISYSNRLIHQPSIFYLFYILYPISMYTSIYINDVYSEYILFDQICEINESPVFLKLNPQAKTSEVSKTVLSPVSF